MKRFIAMVAVMALCIVGVVLTLRQRQQRQEDTRRAEATAAEARAAETAAQSVAASAKAVAPLYPFWTVVDMPVEMPLGPSLPHPTASGVLISKGYLLAPTAGMGVVADDFGRDPTVRVLDGAVWKTGRYVDRDELLDIALIRVDLDGPPVTVAPTDAPASRILTLRMLPTGEFRTALSMPQVCDEQYVSVTHGDLLLGKTHCYVERVPGFAGGLMLDIEGRFVGIQVREQNSRYEQGPGLSTLREYLSFYAQSWGSGVRLKPHL